MRQHDLDQYEAAKADSDELIELVGLSDIGETVRTTKPPMMFITTMMEVGTPELCHHLLKVPMQPAFALPAAFGPKVFCGECLFGMAELDEYADYLDGKHCDFCHKKTKVFHEDTAQLPLAMRRTDDHDRKGAIPVLVTLALCPACHHRSIKETIS